MAEPTYQLRHIVVQLRPGTVVPALFNAHGQHIGIRSNSRTKLRRALAGRHPTHMLMVPAAQLDNLGGEINGRHGGETGPAAEGRQSGVDCGENAP